MKQNEKGKKNFVRVLFFMFFLYFFSFHSFFLALLFLCSSDCALYGDFPLVSVLIIETSRSEL